MPAVDGDHVPEREVGGGDDVRAVGGGRRELGADPPCRGRVHVPHAFPGGVGDLGRRVHHVPGQQGTLVSARDHVDRRSGCVARDRARVQARQQRRLPVEGLHPFGDRGQRAPDDRVGLGPLQEVRPVRPVHPVRGIGEDDLPVLARPPDVIPVQVREHHVGDVPGRDPQAAQAVQELAAAPAVLVELAESRVDQRHPVPRPEQEAPEGQLHVAGAVKIMAAVLPRVRPARDGQHLPAGHVAGPVVHRLDGQRAHSHAAHPTRPGRDRPVAVLPLYPAGTGGTTARLRRHGEGTPP
jgi:hypothetical protein